jgi:hypothetical protein
MKKGTKPARSRRKSARLRAKKKLRVRRKKRKSPHGKLQYKKKNLRWM